MKKYLILAIIILEVAFLGLDSKAQAAFSSTPILEDNFSSTINESIWQIATWVEHGGQTGRDRCFAQDGYLNLNFLNNNGTYLSSAIQTRAEFGYGRWEARLKPSAVPGVLNSFYTIDWIGDNGGAQTQEEIDIEFLTYTFGPNTGKVHFAVHENNASSFQTNPDINLNFNPSDGFKIWGFEITPTQIRWFVKDESTQVEKTLQTYVYINPYPIITQKYQLKLNSWSMVSWIKGPPASGVLANYQIDWIKFYEYISDPTCVQGDGDINCDGEKDITDIQIAVNVFLGIETDPLKIARANKDGLGPISISDIQWVVNLFLGIGG